jgi:2-amino-4-hydroxy-6-hydroxymethyldihydropteridine diphosphokinase
VARVLLGLGGNVGDVRLTFERAVAALCERGDVRLVARSSDYQTPPWGITDQPAFVNACVLVETALEPHALLRLARGVEAKLGRDRTRETRWGPRTLDIDILAYDAEVLDAPDLQLPHPRMAERAFVMVPAAEIAPNWSIGGQTIADLAGRLDSGGILRLT